MKVLITGGTGFVGSHAARTLSDQGHEVRLLIRDAAKTERVLGALGIRDVELVHGDVTDPSEMATAAAGCDAAVHTAAMVALHRSQAAAAHATNTAAAAAVLGAALQAGCDPVVHISSVSVLQQHDGRVDLASPLRDGSTGYSASKVDCEWMARGMQAAGLPLTTLYPSGVIGPDAPGLSVLHTAAQTWIRAMPMISSGVNLVDVRDLAAMIAAALTPGEGPRRLMAGGTFTPWSELVDEIERLRGRRIRRYPAPGAVMRGLGRVVDLTHLPLPIDFELTHETMTEASRAVPCDSSESERLLGVTPRPIVDTLVDTYRWLVSQGALAPEEIGNMLA
ncbi:MAG: NAD-dependent epimerase/dehydratase family protein [Acidimicrobiales bacterium]